MDDIGLNIKVIDDDPFTAEGLCERLENSSSWNDYKISVGEDKILIKPNIEKVFPKEGMNREKFLKYINRRSLGINKHSASLDSKYTPGSIFIVDWQFQKLVWDINLGPEPSGIDICNNIKEHIPHAFCCLMSVHNTLDLQDDLLANVDYLISKPEAATNVGVRNLIRKIVEYLNKIGETPTWDGLLDYSKSSKTVLHAMGASDARNVSATSKGFVEKFGYNLFYSESSLTLPPLDSLLAPKGCIEASQNSFAKLFGARECRFVTNGTTASNSILWASLFNEGDVVLLDKNCHISHHYSAAKQKVNPVYLEPQVVFEPDVFGPPSKVEILNSIDKLYEEGVIDRLKGIVLTNCTFDGCLVSSSNVIKEIDCKIRKISGDAFADKFIYFFDEAWFSFARFDPGLIQFTGMFAASNVILPSGLNPRVYVTQSIHKTLTALRQASVILESDSYANKRGLSGCQTTRFKQSYLSHTTTSPSAPIIASLDIAKCQMAIEGSTLVSEGIDSAKQFRNMLKGDNWATVSDCFHLLPNKTRIVKRKGEKLFQDPSKVTIFHKMPFKYGEAKRRLWADSQIQINKFGYDSFMAMFMPGFKKAQLNNLFSQLKEATINIEIANSEKISFDNLGGVELCINQEGQVISYPYECIKNGYWASGEILFGNLIEDFELLEIKHLSDSDFYIVGTFLTPYPPGFPVFLPGQVVAGSNLKKIDKIDSEIHGLIDGNKALLKKVSVSADFH